MNDGRWTELDQRMQWNENADNHRARVKESERERERRRKKGKNIDKQIVMIISRVNKNKCINICV